MKLTVQLELTDGWHTAFSGGHVGVLLVGNVDNTGHSAQLEARQREVEARLREKLGGLTRAELLELETLNAYRTFYKQFGNTYHVQLQLESVVHKNKSLPSVSPLVDANFAAELETLVLTAGHDADTLELPLTLDAAQGGEPFTAMSGLGKTLKPGDVMMTDAAGIVCTIIAGQDARTPISSTTRRALYAAYAPAGVPEAAVIRQLETILEHIRIFAPGAELEGLELYATNGAPHA